MKLIKRFGTARLLLFLIVVFGLFLRLIFFSGMGISDSLRYSKTAQDFNMGWEVDQDAALTLATRLGLVYPAALSYKLFGVNDFSSVLFVLLTSICSIILIFYFGKLLFNEKIGLVSAFLLSFFPFDVVYSTKLLSDLPSAFFMSLGVYLFLYAEIRQKSKYLYLLSGISIGLGYMIRESALLIALFFVVYILYKKRIKKEYFLVPLGVLIIFMLESLVFLKLTGNPFYRTHASQQYLAEAVSAHNYFGRLDFPTGLFHYPYMILTSNISVFYIFIFIAIFYLLAYKKKETYSLLFWFIPLLLYPSFGSASLTQYIPFRADVRYLSIITLPGILLLAVFLTEKKTLIKRMIMPVSLIILITTSIAFLYISEDRNLLDSLRIAYPYLKALDKPIHIDDRSIKALDYISSYNNPMDLREYPNDLSNLKDAYLVINKEMIKNLRDVNKDRVFPKEIDNPPKEWTEIKEIGKNGDKITIYYVP